jgi:hypothetical protein
MSSVLHHTGARSPGFAQYEAKAAPRTIPVVLDPVK